MGAPGLNEGSTTPSVPAAPTVAPPTSEISLQLGIDKIDDAEKRDAVKTYFEKVLTPEQQKSLLHERAKKDVVKIQKQIEALNLRKATAEQFVQEIIRTMQSDIAERDMNEGYVENGAEHGGYIEQFVDLVGTQDVELSGIGAKSKNFRKSTYDIDWDDQKTFNYCVNFVKQKIMAVPPDVKREIRHQYVQEFISAYAKAIDNFDWTGENFDYDEVKQPEKQLGEGHPELLSFSTWIQQQGKKPEEITYQYTKVDIQAMIAVRTKMVALKKNVESVPKDQQDYYTARFQDVEVLAVSNPTQATTMLGEIEKDMTALKTFTAMGEQISKLPASFDASVQDPAARDRLNQQVTEIKKQYGAKQASLATETDPAKRAGLLDVATVQQLLDKFNQDFDAATKPAAGTTPPGTETPSGNEEEPGIFDMAFEGIVKNDPKLLQSLKDFASKIPLLGGFILTAFVSAKTLKNLGINAPSGDVFSPENLPKLAQEFSAAQKTVPTDPEKRKAYETKARKILKDNFKIEKPSEIDALQMNVKDFLKKAPEGFDAERYTKLTAALKKNGATDTTDKKVWEFILEHVESWAA